MRYSIHNLKKDYMNGEKFEYLLFWGHRPSPKGNITSSCFSQWWKCEFVVENQKYSSMEQYMMAEKARLFKDEEVLQEILNIDDPGRIKSLGRKVKKFDEVLWDENKHNIVLKGNIAKFSQNEELKIFLLSTKNKILVEASPYDRIWGIGLAKEDKNVTNPLLWKGENLLGFILMEVREELKRFEMQ